MAKEVSTETPISGEIVRSRAEIAYDLKIRGKTSAEIAEVLQYDSPSQMNSSIRDRMKIEAQFLDAAERDGILMLELARLDKLQDAIWDQAMYGDLKSVSEIVKIVALRAKLTGLDQLDTRANQAAVLVVGGMEESYVEKLKKMIPGGPETENEGEEE